MPSRDPETGKFTSGGGKTRPEEPQSVVLDQFADCNTPFDGWTNDEFDEGSWQRFQIDSPDDHILLIHSMQTLVSDGPQVISESNPFQVWWFNGTGPMGEGNWTTKVDHPNFVAYQEVSTGPTGTTEGKGFYDASSSLSTHFLRDYGAPLINVDGNITVCTEFLGNGGEVAWMVWYEFMEVERDYLLEELLERSRYGLD